MNMKLIAALAVASSLFANPLLAAETNNSARDCLFASQPQSWRVLDQQQLVLWGPSSKDAYLVKLFASVQDLRFTETLAFIDDNHDGMICEGDQIAVPGSKISTFPTTITSMRKVDEAELTALGEQYKMKLVTNPTKQHDKQVHD